MAASVSLVVLAVQFKASFKRKEFFGTVCSVFCWGVLWCFRTSYVILETACTTACFPSNYAFMAIFLERWWEGSFLDGGRLSFCLITTVFLSLCGLEKYLHRSVLKPSSHGYPTSREDHIQNEGTFLRFSCIVYVVWVFLCVCDVLFFVVVLVLFVLFPNCRDSINNNIFTWEVCKCNLVSKNLY